MSAVPCVGCGWCCISDQCRESHILHGYRKRCPELYWEASEARYKCRLAEDPEHGERYRFLLGVGQGCCARFNAWRGDVKNRDESGG